MHKRLTPLAFLALALMFLFTTRAQAANVAAPFKIQSSRGAGISAMMVALDPNQAPAPASQGSVSWSDGSGNGIWYGPAGSAPNLTVFNSKTCSGTYGFTGTVGQNIQYQFPTLISGLSTQVITLPTIEAAEDGSAWNRSVVNAQMTDTEIRIAHLINDHRKSLGLSQLPILKRLNYISVRHSMWMNDHSEFTHCGDQGFTSSGRAQQAGLGTHTNENIAWGTGTANDIFQAWMNSAGHKATIENPSLTYMGVGVSGLYYTTDFLTSSCTDVSACAGMDLPAVPDAPAQTTGGSTGPNSFTSPVAYTQRYACKLSGNVKGYCWRAVTQIRFVNSSGTALTGQYITLSRQNTSGTWKAWSKLKTNSSGYVTLRVRLYIPVSYRTSVKRASYYVNHVYYRTKWQNGSAARTAYFTRR